MYPDRIMAVPSGEGTAAPAPTSDAAAKSRELWTRMVLLGMILFIVGLVAALMAQSLYPCVPPAGSTVEPPLGECAVFLSPWIVLAVIGLVVTVVAYLRTG